MSLSRLIRFVPPPPSPVETGSPKQWETVEKQLGFQLPEDYKIFIDTYGTGRFNNFLLPYNPFTTYEEANTFVVLDAYHQASRRILTKSPLKWSIVAPFDLYPAPGGLLPWGTILPFGQSLFWLASGPAEHWETIFYDLQVGEYEVWKLSFSSFLSKLLSRDIESVFLPAELPPDHKDICYAQFQFQMRQPNHRHR